jgi:hypothetical protein
VFAAGLGVFATLAVLVTVLYSALTSRRNDPARLLVLRVFGGGTGEPRLETIALRWRLIGPVRMIAGPDLAASSLEPDEFLVFVGRRLKSLFIDTLTALQNRIRTLGTSTDPDGRYRIEELFCFDNTWRAAVDALLDRSDTVLIDLRGFSPERSGTTEELDLLVRRRMIGDTVALVDATTDTGHIDSILTRSPESELTTIDVADMTTDQVVERLISRAGRERHSPSA